MKKTMNSRRPNKLRPRKKRKKFCYMCTNKKDSLDYKEVVALRKFVSERGKIQPRRLTGACAKHQRVIKVAIQKARAIGLLPYVAD
ncbi:Ribosomal protein S18 [Candidatus Magnetomorum sp. HK-1]|nr:Ribosomal protein S18 [Candidatus Magnetomorum sp. HK-1]